MSILGWIRENVLGRRAVETSVPCPKEPVVHGGIPNTDGTVDTVCGENALVITTNDDEVTCSKCLMWMQSKVDRGGLPHITTRRLGGSINPVTDPIRPAPRVYDDPSDVVESLDPTVPFSAVSLISRCADTLGSPSSSPSDPPPSSSSESSGAGDYGGSSGSGGDYGGSTDCGSSSCDSGGGGW